VDIVDDNDGMETRTLQVNPIGTTMRYKANSIIY
jgi:hypothetical protein